MTTQYTTLLKLALPVQGELSGTWGTVVNENITEMIEEAIAGLSTINSWTTNSHVLTTADGTTAESRAAILELADDGLGNPSAAATVICPALSKIYIVKNGCGQTATIKTSAGTGVAIPDGDTALVYCDGTNVVTGSNFFGDIDVDGGTIDGVTLGTNSAITEAQIDNININGNAITSTDTNGNIALTPNGTGEVDISKVDIDSGTIDGTIIGANSAAAGTFTTLTTSSTISGTDMTITTIEATNYKANDGTDAMTITDITGVVTISTELNVDNINISGNSIISTDTDGNIALTPNGTGEVDISKVDIDSGAIDGTTIGAASAAAGTFTNVTATGTIDFTGATVSDLGSVTTVAINGGTIDDTVIGGTTPAAGSFTTGQFGTSLNVDGTVTADGLTVDGGTLLAQGSYPVLSLSDTTSGQEKNMILSVGGANWPYKTVGFYDVTSSAKRLAIADGGDISFYEDTGTTASLVWDSSQTQLKITGRETSRGGGVYAFDVDNSAQSSNLSPAGAMRVTGYYGDSFIVNGLGDVSFFDDSGTAKFFWDASVESLGIGTTSPVADSGYSSVTLDGNTGSQLFLRGAGTDRGLVWASSDFNIEAKSTTPMLFRTNGSERLRINSDGSVVFKPDGTTHDMTLDASGNLLVNTTSVLDPTSTTTNGHTLYGASINVAIHSRNNANPLAVQRTGNDGEIINFFKDTSQVGSIGSNSGTNLIIGTGDTGIYFNAASDAVHPWNIFSNAARDNAIDLGRSADRFKDLYLSGGVVFGATGGSVTSKTLDDYEKGTWTPQVAGSTGGTDPTMGSNNAGWYVRIGNVVHLGGTIHVTNAGSISGSTIVSGLPFLSENTSNHRAGGSLGANAGVFTAEASYPNLSIALDPNETFFYVVKNNDQTNNYSHAVSVATGHMYGFLVSYQTNA